MDAGTTGQPKSVVGYPVISVYSKGRSASSAAARTPIGL